MEAETGDMWPQAKEHLGTPEAGETRKDPSLEPRRECSPEDT